MFDNLIETKRKRTTTFGGGVASIVVHSAAIGLAVVVTAHTVSGKLKEQREEKIDFVKPKEPPPPEVKPPPKEVVNTPPPPKGFQILTAPVEIPKVLPDIDLNKKMTDEADFTGKGAVGGTSKGVEGGVARPVGEQTYYEFQVEKIAQLVPGTGKPTYPEILKNAGVEGKVVVQFVIDTAGRADMSTFKVTESSHPKFTEAVTAAVRAARFLPAEVGGHRVRQQVLWPFNFTIK